MALRDGARIRVGDQELGVERRRELAEAGRTIVVRPGRDRWSSPPPGSRPRRRSSACGRGCGRAMRSSARRRRGRAALGPARPLARRLPAAVRQRRGALRAARRHAHARRPDRRGGAAVRRDGRGAAGPAAGRPRRARLPGGRRGRARARRRRPAAFWRRLADARARRWSAGSGALFDALYRRGGWVLFTRPALALHRGAVRGGRRSCSRRLIGAALRHAVRGRRARSGSAGSCSCSAASRSSPCTRPRTG